MSSILVSPQYAAKRMATNSPRSGCGPGPFFTTSYDTPLGRVSAATAGSWAMSIVARLVAVATLNKSDRVMLLADGVVHARTTLEIRATANNKRRGTIMVDNVRSTSNRLTYWCESEAVLYSDEFHYGSEIQIPDTAIYDQLSITLTDCER